MGIYKDYFIRFSCNLNYLFTTFGFWNCKGELRIFDYISRFISFNVLEISRVFGK